MRKRRKPPLKFDPQDIDNPDGAANPGGYESNNPQARGPGFVSIDAHTPDLAAEHINTIANMLTDDPDVFEAHNEII